MKITLIDVSAVPLTQIPAHVRKHAWGVRYPPAPTARPLSPHGEAGHVLVAVQQEVRGHDGRVHVGAVSPEEAAAAAGCVVAAGEVGVGGAGPIQFVGLRENS